MVMQTVHRKKVNRLRRWLARNTQNLVMYRLGCRKCKGERIMARVISSDKLQDFIYRSRTFQRGDSKPIRPCTCWKEYATERPTRKTLHQIWYDDTPKPGRIIPSFSQ